MCVDNVQAATDADDLDKMSADELYDLSYYIDEICDDCGERLVSHPNFTVSCCNPNCESHHIRIDC